MANSPKTVYHTIGMKINKVSLKIFLGFVALSGMVLIIMSVLVKTSYTKSLKRNEINFQVQATRRTQEQFDSILTIIESAARTISSRPEILATLRQEKRSFAEPADFSINTLLSSLKEMQPFLGNITIAGANGQFHSSSLALKQIEIENLYKYYAHLFEDESWKGYVVDVSNTSFYPENYADVLTCVWPIFDIKTHKLLGQLYLGLGYSIFQEMFMMPSITNNEKFMMIDSVGKIAYNYPAYISFEPVLAAYPQLVYSNDVIIEGIAFDVDSILVSETSRALGWKFIRIIDSKYAMNDSRKLQRYFNAVFAISVVISLVFSLYMAHILTKPIMHLVDGCRRIERGDTSFRVRITSNDEMGLLGQTFNLLMDQLKDDFERALVEQKRQNELKLEILQAQINPHFLYNTLDSIKFLATLQEVNNVANMCSSLIILLKYNLSSQPMATLGEELESIKNYVSLQKYRYGDIFEFTMDIEKDTEKCIIPRFVLQPLVENSLLHGMSDTESGGEIKIHAYFSTENLCLEVIDNGRGMEPGEVDNINRGVERNNAFNNIGISNIRERIHLQFGEKAALVFLSGQETGTVAKMYFPSEKVKKS
jgi:two-component system sensor histidine kinase YesM